VAAAKKIVIRTKDQTGLAYRVGQIAAASAPRKPISKEVALL